MILKKVEIDKLQKYVDLVTAQTSMAITGVKEKVKELKEEIQRNEKETIEVEEIEEQDCMIL